jgi:hydrogenase maturation protein HypF
VPFRLPGGDKAVEQPWRSGLSLLRESLGDDAPGELPLFRALDATSIDAVSRMIGRGVRSPLTTSVGRLFDGVSAILGLCSHSTHQAQAAQQLEWAAWRHGAPRLELPLPLTDQGLPRLDWRETVRGVVRALGRGADVGEIAAAFHVALARGALRLVERLDAPRVALAGGVFCNRLLTETLLEGLEAAGRRGFIHGQLPPTDGSLAVGQLWVAAHGGAAGATRGAD